jgi:hypothetical protein
VTQLLPLLLAKLSYGAMVFFLPILADTARSDFMNMMDSDFANSEMAKVFVDFVPEVLAFVTLVWVGFRTPNKWNGLGDERESCQAESEDWKEGPSGFYPLGSLSSREERCILRRLMAGDGRMFRYMDCECIWSGLLTDFSLVSVSNVISED